jgi:hypothetical protein
MITRIGQIWKRATPQVRRPVYVGLAVGFVLAALVVLGVANTDAFFVLPSNLGGVATSEAIWGLKPSNLLMVLPLGAFLVVLARSFVGLKAFGLFTPMLIALAFLQIGPIMGPVVLCSSVAVGMIVTPSLLKLRMTRVGFLGVLISLIVLVLVALMMVLDTKLQVDAFPVIVCALVVERWWKQVGKDGAKPAAKMAANTFVLAVVIEFVMVSHFALALIEWSPLLMPAFTAVAIGILGRYRGLRLSEIHRFLPIWLERRRNARNQTSAEEPLDENYASAETHAADGSQPPAFTAWVIRNRDDFPWKPVIAEQRRPNRKPYRKPRITRTGPIRGRGTWPILSVADLWPPDWSRDDGDGRDPRHQHAQRIDREIQSAPRDRARA